MKTIYKNTLCCIFLQFSGMLTAPRIPERAGVEETVLKKDSQVLQDTKRSGYNYLRGDTPRTELNAALDAPLDREMARSIIKDTDTTIGTMYPPVTLAASPSALEASISLKTPVATISGDIITASRAYDELDKLVFEKKALLPEDKIKAQQLIEEVRSWLGATAEAAQTDRVLKTLRANLEDNLNNLLDKQTRARLAINTLDIVSPYSQLEKLTTQEKLSAEEKTTLQKLLDTTETSIDTYQRTATNQQDASVAASLRANFDDLKQRALSRLSAENRPDLSAESISSKLVATLTAAQGSIALYVQAGQKSVASSLEHITGLTENIHQRTMRALSQVSNAPESALILLSLVVHTLESLKEAVFTTQEDTSKQAQELYHNTVQLVLEAISKLKDRLTQNTLLDRLYQRVNSLT